MLEENGDRLVDVAYADGTAISFDIPTLRVTKKAGRTMAAGERLQLVGADDQGKAIKTCKSSARKVASVTRDGLIVARKKGKAKITVTLNNKKKIVLTVTVK